MTIASWYNRSALGLMVLAILAYSTASRTPEFGVLSIPAVFALWRLSSRKTGRFVLPRFVVNILLFAVLAYAVLRAQGRPDVETIAQVVVLIQVIKIGDRRAPRDDAQILSLSVFLAIAAMLDSNDVWTGVILMMFLPVLVSTVMLFQLYKGAVHADLASIEGTGMATASAAREFRGRLRLTSAVATAGTLALALVVFVLMPRGIGENAFGQFGAPRNRRETGFTSSVTLGAKGIISTSPTVVFDLVIKDEGGENVGMADTVHYLRGAVLTQYENRKWTGSPPDRKHMVDTPMTPGVEQDPFKIIPHWSGPVIQQSISMRSSSGGDRWSHLFAEWLPVQITFGREGTFLCNRSTFVLQRRSEPGPFAYTVWSALIEPAREGASARTVVQLDSAPLKELAASILTRAGLEADPAVRSPDDDSKAARAIQDYLRLNYSYTLEQESPPRDVDPVEHFLFERKQGHCEYFASAMVLLCRSAGINARMITGYIATEYSPATGAYMVRESNAHAWVEAEDGDHRWRRFDPTPPDDLARIHKPALGLLGGLRHALEAVEYAWNSSIVAFNERTRQNLLGPSSGEHAGLLGRIERVSKRVREAGGPRLMISAFLAGVVVFAGVAAAGFVLAFVLRFVPRLAIRGSGLTLGATSGGRVEVGFYRALLRALARRGLAKPAWRPPLEHAEALARVDAVLAADVRGVVDAYYAQRFSGHRVDKEHSRQLAAAVRRVGRVHPQRA